MTTPGIPNEFAFSTSGFGARLANIQDQVFAAVGMGFRRLELGLTDSPPSMDGLEEARRETGVTMVSMVVGCRDTMGRDLPAAKLASLDDAERNRAMSSLRRHARLATGWGCRRLIVRGSSVEDPALRAEARALEARALQNGVSPELREEVGRYVERVQAAGQPQLQVLCRSLHEVMTEHPLLEFAIEPGLYIDDLLGFDAVGWVLDDLRSKGIGYWHDVGRIHLREKQGLPAHEKWLERFASRMVGVHLQDAADTETAMPVGVGEVDFAMLREYVPANAERVLELHPRHGRAEILASIRMLLDRSF